MKSLGLTGLKYLPQVTEAGITELAPNTHLSDSTNSVWCLYHQQDCPIHPVLSWEEVKKRLLTAP